MSVLGTALRRVSNFLSKDEDGGLTVEAVLWLPVYLIFFSFIADVSLILHGQSKAMRIVQDSHRAASLGHYAKRDDPESVLIQRTEAVIEERLKRLASSAEATTEISGGIIRTTVSLQASDLSAIGFFAQITNQKLSFSNYHLTARG